MENITLKQYKTIKAGFINDKHYTKHNQLEHPIMGMKIEDVKLIYPKKSITKLSKTYSQIYEVHTKNKIFKLYEQSTSIAYTHYVITINDIIYYHKFDSLFLNVDNAFTILTELYLINTINKKHGWDLITKHNNTSFMMKYDRKESKTNPNNNIIIIQDQNLLNEQYNKLYTHLL